MALPTNTDPAPRTRPRAVALPVAGIILLIAVLLSGVSSPSAGADTTGTPPTYTGKVGAGTAVTSPGPITGLADKDVVSITVTQADASANAITGLVRIAQCAGGLTIPDVASLSPGVNGNCLFNPGNDTDHTFFAKDVTKDAPTDDHISYDFKVFKGSQDVPLDEGGTHTVTCDDTHSCALWVAVARGVNTDFLRLDLAFGTGTVNSSSTSTSTSTSLPGGSSSTSTSVGTSSSTSSSSTSTSVGSTSSSTTTTLPNGTTITNPATTPGGTVSIKSNGWQSNSTVKVTLHSDPVALPDLTADATGNVNATITIPATTPVGAHTLELTGKKTDGTTRTPVNIGITVSATGSSSSTSTSAGAATTATVASVANRSSSSSGGGLAATGSNALRIGLSAALALFAGWLLLVSAVHRRDRLDHR